MLRADQRVMAYQSIEKTDDILDVCRILPGDDPLCQNNAWFKFHDLNSVQGGRALAESSISADLTFSITVLTYCRPKSLERLLKSLFIAEYGGETVPLRIHIDGPLPGADISTLNNISNTIHIAETFHWPHGPLSIYKREINVGLARQWYEAWDPSADNELAFIFEDDTEVSPLYFQWSTSAARKYYSRPMKLVHWDLLNSVRGDKTSWANPEKVMSGYLRAFAERFAGVPIMYGVCLQKQHLDPFHYPKKLRVMNANQPFLFSLIGSWGPLMFPLAWQAFREWFVPFSYNYLILDTEITYLCYFPLLTITPLLPSIHVWFLVLMNNYEGGHGLLREGRFH